MRTSIRTWLASVGVMAGAGGATVSAQALPTIPIPDPTPTNAVRQEVKPAAQPAPKPAAQPMPMPMPMPMPKTEQGKPVPMPMPMPKPELPPLPTLEAPTNFMPGCSTCGDVNPNCADPGCAGDLIRGPKDPVWMSYSQLLLWFQPTRPVTIAVSGPPNRLLLDGENQLGMYYGYKVDGGMWLNHEHTFGFGADGFITEHRSNFQRASGGIINRPFFDATTGLLTNLAVSNEPTFAGSIASTNTARLASAGINLRRNVAYNEQWQIDLFYGFRYYDVDESLVIYQTTTLPAAITLNGQTVNAGTSVMLRDRSYTRNQFWGGDVGTRMEWKHGLGFFALTPKLAFGSTHQITQISGETRAMTPNVTVPGGLLAAGGVNPATGLQDGNLGRFVTNRFGIATDIGFQAGLNITKNARVAIGYQFYYLNNVARPGAQFDQTVNQRVVPVSPAFGALTGVRAPNVTFDREGFYAHGVALTMEARY